jgi:putative flippase GtrA
MFFKKGDWSSVVQIVRYAVVGVLTNLFGYLIYIGVTWLWLEPKLAITILYPVGAITAYFGHARYSFSYQGRTKHGLLRYVIAHAVGYSMNVLMLYIFSDMMRFRHQAVQAAAIVVVAGMLFLLFKYFVFAPSKRHGNCPC